MINRPLVSVLLPVFNSESYIGESLESILNQTYRNLEILVVDDGSTDRTYPIVHSYNDDRIKLFKFEENKGLIEALNYGLNVAKGDFVARMDADDYSFPDRIEKQVEFLEKNQEYAGCGTSIFQWEDTRLNLIKYPESHSKIDACVRLYYHNLCHPTVMFRSSIFSENKYRFNENYIHAEDYYLWYELLENEKLCNLPSPLLKYRLHPHQVSERLSGHQFQTLRKILEEKSGVFFDRPMTQDEFQLHFLLLTAEPFDKDSKIDFKKLNRYRKKLISETTYQVFHQEREWFNATISFKYFKCCIRYKSGPITALTAFVKLLLSDAKIGYYFTGRLLNWTIKDVNLKKDQLRKTSQSLIVKLIHPIRHFLYYRRGILLNDFGIGFKDIPKTASTSVKHAFYKLLHDKEYQYDRKKHPNRHIHWYFKNQIPIDDAKIKIIIVRDPVDRFLSAYSNRVLHHGDLSSEVLKKRPSKSFKFDPSMDEFINNFSVYVKTKAIEWHTRPVSKWVGGSLDMYTHVFSIEQIEEFEQLMESETGKTFSLQMLQKSKKNNLLSTLTPVQLQKIINLYAEDYDLLKDFYTPETVWSRYFEGRSNLSGK